MPHHTTPAPADTLRLAIRRSVPPTTMPGYYRTWQTWERIAVALGVHDRDLYGPIRREYWRAAWRAAEEARS